MATESGKPLPQLPDVPITRLSINARAHRAKFVRWLLQNEGSVEDDYKEEWSCILEDALDSLGENVAHGGWLASAWARKRDAESSRADQEREASTGSEPVKFDSLTSADVLQDLRDRIRFPLSSQTKHLVLCLSGPGRLTDEEDGGYDFVPKNIGCVFRSGHFNASDTNASFLYGTDTWDRKDNKAKSSQVVGGTFAFKGLTNKTQYTQLAKILRITIYFQLSMILEQQVLLDLGLPIHFPSRPAIRHAPSSSAEPFTPKPKHLGNSPAGLLSFLQRKGAGLFRTRKQESPVEPVAVRTGSLDSSPSSPLNEPRKRRSSFMPSSPATSLPSMEAMQRPSEQFHFSENLRKIRQNQEFLSTCVGVSFHPPKLLEDLAAREEELHLQGKQLILKGDEKVGLRSLTMGKPGVLSNSALFVSAQRISVVLSKYVWSPSSSSAAPEVPENQEASEPPPTELKQCETFQEESLYFYARGELSLGQAIHKWVNEADEACNAEDCVFKRGNHILQYAHGGTRINVEIKDHTEVDSTSSDDIYVWENSVCCNAALGRKRLSDASALLSLGKFIEMLIYSPTMKKSNVHCSHGPKVADLRRNFLLKGKVVVIGVDQVGAVLEIRVPRLQIVQDELDILVTEQRTASDCDTNGQRKTLRREIRHWCEAVADCVEDLERTLQVAVDTPHMKSLPRLPSEDTSDDLDDSATTPTTPTTPRPRASSMLRSDSLLSTFASHINQGYRASKEEPTPTAESSGMQYRESLIAISSAADSDTDPAEKVSALRTGFQQVEQELYSQVAKARVEELNIVRRAFLLAGETVKNALIAAHPRSKDTMKSKGDMPRLPFESQLQESQPEWWAKTCHVVPKGNVIIREDDWGSIIAFTMSTPEYHSELENMDHSGPLVDPPSEHSSAASTSASAPSSSGFLSLFRTTTGTSATSSRSFSSYEPDGLDGFSGVVSRKEHPRDPTGILSIRDVLRAKPASIFTDNGGTRGAARSVSIGSASTNDQDKDVLADGIRKRASKAAPPTSWGTMNSASDAALNLQTVTGEVSKFSDSSEAAKDDTQPKANFSNVSSDGSDHDTVKNDEEVPPAVPAKDRPTLPAAPVKRPSFVSLSSGLSAAMKYMTSGPADDGQNDAPRLVPPGQRIDDRPHIKYDWTIGKKLRFSCTVYYAKQFDLLRRRCGLFDDVFLKSLSRSANWNAEGGKSKSNFWKTADDRFIIKTLVNAWNVGDLQVLIDLSPAYFQYMESTSSEATVLAKLAGFYTIEIRNLETGAVQAKADLLVMENLFCQQKIDRTFDLKGMKSRKASSQSSEDKTTKTKTLFDADWVEGQQKDLIYVQPHSKAIIQEALKRDADFLADSNIMDYSLLVGIDDSNKQISCGLVDTIGSYTFAKTLEYKAKQGLAGGTRKEVTVVPPNEYRDRFLKALSSYFVACPDKWTCFEGEDVAQGGQEDLPSVF